jgi:hypothetical protein
MRPPSWMMTTNPPNNWFHADLPLPAKGRLSERMESCRFRKKNWPHTESTELAEFSRAVSSALVVRRLMGGSGRHGAPVDEARSLRLSGTGERWNAAEGHPRFWEGDADRSVVSAAHGSRSITPPEPKPPPQMTVISRERRAKAAPRAAPWRDREIYFLLLVTCRVPRTSPIRRLLRPTRWRGLPHPASPGPTLDFSALQPLERTPTTVWPGLEMTAGFVQQGTRGAG